MTGSRRVVVRAEPIAEVPPDAADLVVTVEVRDRRRDRAVARLAERQQELTDAVADAITTGLVEVRDAGARGGPAPVAFALAAPAPSLDLQPAPQQVRGAVEATFTMSEPDQEVHQR